MFKKRKKLWNTKSKKAFGLLGLALSLGATGAFVTQNSYNSVLRKNSSYSLKYKSLYDKNMGLKIAYSSYYEAIEEYCDWHKNGAPSSLFHWSRVIKRCENTIVTRSRDYVIEELKRKVENLDTRLKTVEKDLGEIKTNTAQTNVLLRELIDKIGKST